MDEEAFERLTEAVAALTLAVTEVIAWGKRTDKAVKELTHAMDVLQEQLRE